MHTPPGINKRERRRDSDIVFRYGARALSGNCVCRRPDFLGPLAYFIANMVSACRLPFNLSPTVGECITAEPQVVCGSNNKKPLTIPVDGCFAAGFAGGFPNPA
jgi:hypothetical protein